ISAVDDDLLEELPALADEGVVSFKVSTTDINECAMLPYHEIEKLARYMAKAGLVLRVHAEDDLVIKQATGHLVAKGRTQPAYFGLSRPAIAEVNALRKLGNIALRTGCKIYIEQLSTGAGLELAEQYPNLILETTPQHLLLDENVYNRSDGRMFVDCPPLRRQSDNQLLWNGLRTDKIRTIGSNHRPFSLDDKPRNLPFHSIPKGFYGVGTLFPLLLAKFLEDGTDLRYLVKLLCENPARIFGMYPRKGCLYERSAADLVIVDPTAVTDELSGPSDSCGDWNPYQGLPAVFPEMVFLQGKKQGN
ncbi:MAG: amidohydrolase family protein, partial [FCB group bacterium]|nr:amidohydrolase family protein [FCB group bacterium]